mmetsp:Transcript_76602/g.216630  ORF Transcript_76602/g.216630 Transcript_76602/m.216630 type:complete len:234 (-) Transcript_76602:19-720(-)
MVDSRAALPQQFAGGSAGLPCARWHPQKRGATQLPELSLRPRSTGGEHLPGCRVDTRPEYTSFHGTKTMSWGVARARSMGALQTGGTLDRALQLRTGTDFDFLINILVKAMPTERQEDLRHFRQPYHKSRKTVSNWIPEDERRQMVLAAMQKYPLCDIYDLARCPPNRWAEISRELGGVNFGTVMRYTLEHVEKGMTPLDRASFWTAAGPQQMVVDHGRICGFASDKSPLMAR